MGMDDVRHTTVHKERLAIHPEVVLAYLRSFRDPGFREFRKRTVFRDKIYEKAAQ